jgi:hypothetical protein
MALIGNFSVLHKSPTRSLGGTVTSGDAAAWNKPGLLRSRADGFVQRQVSIPLGFSNEGAWFYPRTAGGMVLRGDGDGTLNANLFPSRNMAVNLTGQGDLSGVAGLVISMLCAMTGSGTLTANCSGALNMSANFTGQGGLQAGIAGIASMVSNMAGSGGLQAAIAAYGNMSIDITVTGAGLSTANVGAAVWSALAATNNDPATMGALLNASGAGGDLWAVTLDGTYTAAELMRIMASVLAGSATGTNQPGVTKFKSLDGTKDRVTSTQTEGARTTTALDGA